MRTDDRRVIDTPWVILERGYHLPVTSQDVAEDLKALPSARSRCDLVRSAWRHRVAATPSEFPPAMTVHAIFSGWFAVVPGSNPFESTAMCSVRPLSFFSASYPRLDPGAVSAPRID